MSDIGDAFGTALEGALVSRAVEGEKGAPLAQGHFAEGTCLNCGTELTGSYCHACGQKAHLHRTIGAFMHDLLHGALHFEGKTWKTLPKLFLKPGELTRRYIDGERARFVSPMALFLFVIFLMFAVFQMAGISTPTEMPKFNAGGSIEEVRAKATDQLTKAEEDAARYAEGTPERKAADALAANAKETLEGMEKVETYGISTDAEINLTGVESIDKGLIEKWRKNPTLMLYKLQTNFYKFSWLLIPISVPFMWLLFAWKRQFRLYDHAVFVTYSLSFMTLFTLIMTLLGLAGTPIPIVVLSSIFVPLVHIYRQLRGAYGLSRFSALWRLTVLTGFINVILLLFLQALLLLGGF